MLRSFVGDLFGPLSIQNRRGSDLEARIGVSFRPLYIRGFTSLYVCIVIYRFLGRNVKFLSPMN